MTHPILLLEMNEVPWRLIDRYKSDPRYPHLGNFFKHSDTYTTVAVDSGELSPWVTWPSFHRGLSNDRHGIRNLGQDPASFHGIPIWDEFRARGLSIGICGSLQSWPPQFPGEDGFYIPDTFAHDSRCIPSFVEPFQAFNLSLVKRNGRVVAQGLPLSRKLWDMAKGLPRYGIRPSTYLAVAKQLAGERRDRTLVARRPIFQTVLMWDIFRRLFHPARPPAFSTFFTNHVAGVMHRYWHHVFPEDFGERFDATKHIHADTMNFAVAQMDRILGEAMRFCDRNKALRLVFASSMGQAAIKREDHEGIEAAVVDLAKLISCCEVPENAWTPLLAMVPQVAVSVGDASLRRGLAASLNSAKTKTNFKLFSVDEIGTGLTITIHTPRKPEIEAGGFSLTTLTGKLKSVGWEESGIAILTVEPGTGYHIPEGAMAVYGAGIAARDSRREIRADAAKELLLELAGLS